MIRVLSCRWLTRFHWNCLSQTVHSSYLELSRVADSLYNKGTVVKYGSLPSCGTVSYYGSLDVLVSLMNNGSLVDLGTVMFYGSLWH